MARFNLDYSASKTYATEANAEKAVAQRGFDDLRYFLMPTKEGRWFPVFTDRQSMDRGVHFHFHVV